MMRSPVESVISLMEDDDDERLDSHCQRVKPPSTTAELATSFIRCGLPSRVRAGAQDSG